MADHVPKLLARIEELEAELERVRESRRGSDTARALVEDIMRRAQHTEYALKVGGMTTGANFARQAYDLADDALRWWDGDPYEHGDGTDPPRTAEGGGTTSTDAEPS